MKTLLIGSRRSKLAQTQSRLVQEHLLTAWPAESLSSPKLIVSGHSHRPKFIVTCPGHGTFIEPFDFQQDDEKTIKLPQDGCLIVDAGSLARAELEPSIRGDRPGRGPVRFGTYGLIDFVEGQALLRRIEIHPAG